MWGKPHRGISGHCYHSPCERVAQAEALKSKGIGRTSRLGQTGVEGLLEGGGNSDSPWKTGCTAACELMKGRLRKILNGQ